MYLLQNGSFPYNLKEKMKMLKVYIYYLPKKTIIKNITKKGQD